jgi:hypothetical protein
MIPERLEDPYTIIYQKGERHTIYTHLGCVLLRIILGLLIYFKVGFFKSILPLLIIYIMIIIFFSNKVFKTKNKTWKVYFRTILLYSLGLIINSIDYITNNNSNKNISGILIIIDAIMGLQSRHIQNNFKE